MCHVTSTSIAKLESCLPTGKHKNSTVLINYRMAKKELYEKNAKW
jgi:hypothetical protein